MENEKQPLIGKTLEELQDVAYRGGMPKFVGKQLCEWLYVKKATRFDQMVNISKKNQAWLADNYEIGRTAPAKHAKSQDGTVKYLFAVGEGRSVESVYIPDKERATLCVSSQSGCKMNCYFCATGKMGFRKQLTAAQIINQILSIPPEGSNMQPLTNVVFMGMGEPLDNFREVKRGLHTYPDRAMGLGMEPEAHHGVDSGQTPRAEGPAGPHPGACGHQRAYRRYCPARVDDARTEGFPHRVGDAPAQRLRFQPSAPAQPGVYNVARRE